MNTDTINFATRQLELGMIDPEAFLSLTGIEVSPELKKKIKQASKDFVIGTPLADQAEARFECELERTKHERA